MKLTVNGDEKDIQNSSTISHLLVEQNVKMPEMVSVELNGQILRRSDFDSTTIQEGDRVEFLYFMGGGQWD